MIPPKIALWGCWAVALYLLWSDTKSRKDISRTLWLPTLWMMRCASRGVDYWLGGGTDTGRIDPLCIAIMLIAGFSVLSKRRCNWSGIFAHNSGLFFFYGYLMLSTLWVDDLENPLIKIFRPLGDFVMALVVATEKNPREAIVTMFRRCCFLLIPMSIVLIRYYSYIGCVQSKHWGNDMWVGVTTHKNPLGQLCLVSGLAFFWQLETARKTGLRLWKQFTPWIYLAMTAYLFYGGGGSEQRSSTAIVCLFMVVVIYLALGFFRSRPGLVFKSIIGGAVAVALLALILQFFGTSLQGVVAATQGKDATLTDRTYLWQDVIRIGMRNPILGSGYGGFWVPSIYNELSPEADNHPKEAHNGYLETFANLGLLGAGLLAILLWQSLRSASQTVANDFEYGRLRLAVLFMVLIMNYSEATFTVGNHLWWFGFLVVAVYANPWVYDAAKSGQDSEGRREIFESEEESYIG